MNNKKLYWTHLYILNINLMSNQVIKILDLLYRIKNRYINLDMTF
jgi:hypothetical protein